MKFEDQFDEPDMFSDHSIVVRGDISAAEAAERINAAYPKVDPVEPDQLKKDYVRFGFAPEYVEELHGKLCWYTGAKQGRGAKPVWVYS